MGTLLCKNSAVCLTVYCLLRENIGKSVSQLGELDVQDNTNQFFRVPSNRYFSTAGDVE